MTATAVQHEQTGPSVPGRVVFLRLLVLLALWAAAFRTEFQTVFWAAEEFSEWSHVFCLPIVVLAYIWCRRGELRECDARPSVLGLLLIVLGALIWFGRTTLGLFGYLALIAMLVALAGVVLLAAGRQAFRITLPLVIMFGTCLPLFERSMDRFTIPVQRISIRVAAAAMSPFVPIEVSDDGIMAAQHEGRTVRIGAGEQRFGLRLGPACVMLILFVIFSRRRPLWQLALLCVTAVPVLLLANILRIITWAATAILGGFAETDATPRNAAAIAALLLTYLAIGGLAWFLGAVSRLGQLVYVEAGGDDDKSDTSVNKT
jgi:exosortase/archaeosortase family protein